MRWGRGVAAAAALMLAGMFPGALPGAAAETMRIGGTGFVIATMRLLGERLAELRPDIQVEVLPSLGSSGGLAALADGAIELAVSARALIEEERAKGLREAACAVTPLTFATSRAPATTLALRDLPRLFTEPSPRWADGTPLKVILRSRSGSEIPYLSERLPGMADAFAAAFKRPGIAVGSSDQENADLAQRIDGSLAVITVLQIRTEGLSLQPLALDGQAPTPEALAAGTWPLPMRFCLIVPTAPVPGVRHMVALFKSPEGRALLARAGALRID